MKNYSYREGDKILQKLINSNDKKDKYVLSTHLITQANKRNINLKYLESKLINEEPLGLLSTRKNRFKVFFPSESSPDTHDLIVIIAIDDDKKIIGVTTYEDPITYREGVK